MVDLLDPVVLLHRHIVEAGHRGQTLERGLELAQTLRGGTGPHVLVVVEDQQTVLVANRDDGLGEVAARPRSRGPFLGLRGVGVDVVAGEALQGGDQVGADALRNDEAVVVGGRVGHHRAAVGAHRDAAHRLHTAGDHQVVPARTDLLSGGVDRLQAGGAEPVELHAADGVGHARGDDRGAGDVAALVADRRDAAQDDVADHVLVQAGMPATQFVDQAGDEIERLDLGQGAVLALPARGADGLVDEGFFGHVFPS